MNIFALHLDPKIAASYHCDKHVVKMIVESAQMISTIFEKYNGYEKWMYKPCFPHHPCTLWAGESRRNLIWLIDLGFHLCEQYQEIYCKPRLNKKGEMKPPKKTHHKCHGMFLLWKKKVYDLAIPDKKFSVFALAMPDYIKDKVGEDYNIIQAINCYREYYILEKAYMAKWKSRKEPDWFKNKTI